MRLPLLVLLLMLPLPSTLTAAPAAAPAPEWAVGDFWQYLVADGSGKPLGNLTVRVVSDGEVPLGNSTVRAYTLSQRLQPWTPPANETKLSEEARWGPIYTVVTTTLIIDRQTLCTLGSNSTIRSVHYADVTEDRESLVYSPSDGRLRFPLSAGMSWNVSFNLTRTRQYPFHFITANSTIARSYECRSYETLPDGKEGFCIRCPDDGTGQETVSWYGPRYRSEVRREERNAAAGTVRVYTLQKSRSSVAPSIFSSPRTLLAIAFGVAAAVMLAVAVFAAYRARHPVTRRDRKKGLDPKAAPGGPPRASPAPAPPAGRGPGRIL